MANFRGFIHPRKKQKVLENFNFTCCSCGVSGEFNTMEVDHIIPIAEGGDNSESNLQCLCYKCNMAKRWGKIEEDKNEKSPIEKLEIVTGKIKEYSYLSWNEFKIIFNLDPIFRLMKLNLDVVYDYYLQVNGKSRSSETEERDSRKSWKKQRDLAIRLLISKANMTQHEICYEFKSAGIPISQAQISFINVS